MYGDNPRIFMRKWLTSKQTALWNHSAALCSTLNGKSTPEEWKEYLDARQAYWDSLLPYQVQQNDLVLMARKPTNKQERLKELHLGMATLPDGNMLLMTAKRRGIPENDPLLVRALEARNKGEREEITLEEVDSAIMEFIEAGA
jgi:hypothetical protein